MGTPIAADQPLLIRTDFRSEDVWRLIEIEADKLRSPGTEPGDFLGLSVINDQNLAGSSFAALTTLVGGVARNHVFVADANTMDDPEHPILVVGPETSAGSGVFSTFRVILSQFTTVADNLALANVDFDEFSTAASAEGGLFRGFRAPPQQREVPLTALLDAAREHRLSSEAIGLFYDFVESRRRRWSVWNILDIVDIRSLYTDMLDQDFSQSRELVGLEGFLQAAKQGGRASTVLMPAGGGFWSAILDSDTLAPRAAMLNRR